LVENGTRPAETIIEKAASSKLSRFRPADVKPPNGGPEGRCEQAREVARADPPRKWRQGAMRLVGERDRRGARVPRTGCWTNRGRVHGEFSGLLERTRKHTGPRRLAADRAAERQRRRPHWTQQRPDTGQSPRWCPRCRSLSPAASRSPG
jgi:hypothetical protein